MSWTDHPSVATTSVTKQILNLFPTGRVAAEEAEAHQVHDRPRSGVPTNELGQHDATDERLRELNSQIEMYPAQQQQPEGEQEDEEAEEGGRNYSSPHRGEHVTRPGDQYLWHSIQTELPVEQQTLLQAGADLLAITRDDLARVVKALETQFRGLVKNQRRKEMRGGRMDVD